MTAPWQVLVPGFPGLEFDDYREAKRALRRLRKADRRRSKSSVAQAAPAYPNAPAPAVVCEPARQQPETSTFKPFPVVGVACGAKDQLTTRRA